MADKSDRKQLKFILPKGIAIYPKLVKPDTKFDKDGKFEVKQKFEADVIEPVIEKLVELRDAFAAEKAAEFAASKDGKVKARAKNIKVRDVGTPNYDADGNETGLIELKAASKASGKREDGSTWERKIPLFDAKGKKTNPKAVYGGSELKVAVIAEAYYKADGNEVGVTLRIDAVQIIKLVAAGGKDADSFGFGAEEGYEDDAEENQFGDETGDEPTTSKAGASEPDDF